MIVEKIITDRKYELTGTKDHKIDVINNDGYITVKTINELTTDDYIVINKNMNVFGDNLKLPSHWEVNTDDLDVRTKILTYPRELTLSFARFLGYMVADGTL